MSEAPTPDELLEAALGYAAAGLKIYPVFIRGLKPDGKKDVHVPIRSWAEQATDDLEQVRRWWDGQYAGAGIGVDMGRSHLAVADADVKDSVDGISRLESELTAETRGASVYSEVPYSRTPSGGVHAWWSDPRGEMGSGSNIFGTKDEPSGVDGRGVGGTIFMPPTFVPGYGRYAWADDRPPDFSALPEVPGALAAVCPPGGRGKRAERERAAGTEVHGESARSTRLPDQSPFMTAGAALAAGMAGAVVHRDRIMTEAAAKERLQPLWEAVRDTKSPNGLWQAVADFARAAAHYQCFWDQGVVERMVLAAYAEGGHGYEYLDSGDLRAIAGGYELQAAARAAGDLDQGWVAMPAAGLDGVMMDAAADAVTDDAVDALLAEMLTPEQAKDRPLKRYLIKKLLHLDSEVWLIGAPGSRKSFVALDMAGHIAAGKPWQGRRVHQGPVVIIAAEGASGLGGRIKAYEAVHGPMPSSVHILPRPVQAADHAGWAVLVKACARLGPVLVVIDTQARVTVGLKENAAEEMGIFVQAVARVRMATGACVMAVHHTGRVGGDARGSSALDGAQDTELKVVTSKEPLRGELRMEKQKDMEEGEPIKLAFSVHPVGQDEDGEVITSLAVLGQDAWRGADQSVGLPEDWETGWPGVQAQILRVLAEQGGTVGLTKADVKRNVADRWYEGQTGRAKGLRTSTFDTAWTRVREAETASGEMVVTGSGGQRWALDQGALAEFSGAS